MGLKESFAKIQALPDSSANPELIKKACDAHILREKDRDFYLEIWKKSKGHLTEKQLEYKRNLNRRIVAELRLE